MADGRIESEQSHDRQGGLFLFLYALAWAGGAIAYVPLLTLILPAFVSGLAGDDAVSWIATLAFVGAASASLCNIAFGWASDLTGRRRLWVAAGLVFSCALLVHIDSATDLESLTIAIIAWQLATNMMLAPLAAWAGDCVPDAQKGRLGGLLAFAPAMGALSGAIITWPGLIATEYRLSVVAAMVVACVLPLIVFGRPRAFAGLLRDAPDRPAHSPVAGMWFARLLLQISEAALFAFLLVWLQSLSPDFDESDAALLFGAVVFAAIPLALVAGRWADRASRPIVPLIAAALVAALGLLVMAGAPTTTIAVTGYGLFGVAGAVFLALHSAQTLRVLPRASRRGRDLGFFNLTNTIPALVMPGIALSLVPVFGFAGLFVALAALAVCAALCLIGVMRWAQSP